MSFATVSPTAMSNCYTIISTYPGEGSHQHKGLMLMISSVKVMVDCSGSPYSSSSGLVMPSPAARTWPGSQIVHASPASRMGMAPSPSHPSLRASPSQHKDVDHSNEMDALDKLVIPVPTASCGRGIGGSLSCTPLESFLVSHLLKCYMQRILSSDERVKFVKKCAHDTDCMSYLDVGATLDPLVPLFTEGFM